MSALTVVILTKDEEAMIGRAIASVSFADEVVVCDGGSSDTTIDIARRAGARVIERPFDDFARQRNFALSEATGEWILFVDADERGTPELASELRALLEAGPERDSYRVPRRSMVLGRWIDWHYEGPDAPVRLVRAGSGTWVSRVHERFEGAGEPGMLSGTLLHLTHRSISDVMRKIEAYSTLEAEELASLGARPPRARSPRRVPEGAVAPLALRAPARRNGRRRRSRAARLLPDARRREGVGAHARRVARPDLRARRPRDREGGAGPMKRSIARALSKLHRRIHAYEDREAQPVFGSLGAGSAVRLPSLLHHPERLHVGVNSTIHPYCRIEIITENPHLDGPPLPGADARIVIGDRVVINSFAHLGSMESIVLGDDVGIASGVCIEDHHYLYEDATEDRPLKKQGFRVAPVVIEDGVMIGEHATILPGVRIGRNSWIGANAVVTKDVPPYSVAAGVPARVVRRMDTATGRWERVDLAVEER